MIQEPGYKRKKKKIRNRKNTTGKTPQEPESCNRILEIQYRKYDTGNITQKVEYRKFDTESRKETDYRKQKAGNVIQEN